MNLPAAGAEKRDLVALSVILERLLRLRAAPISMQLFKSAAAMQAIPRLRRPRAVHTMDQVVAQAARLGWTVGVTAADLVGDQCRAVVGLSPQDAQWRSGAQMVGVWFATVEDAGNHQEAMQCMPFGGHEALVVSPLGRGGSSRRTSSCSMRRRGP